MYFLIDAITNQVWAKDFGFKKYKILSMMIS
jgi:hypothetical protein